jgi:hypothetical protein
MTFHASSATRLWDRRGWRSATIVLAAAAFLSISGAFGLESAPIVERFAFWLVLLALGTRASSAMRPLLARQAGFASRPILTAVATAGTLSLPLTGAGMLARNLTFGPASLGWSAWAYVFGVVLVMSAAISTLRGLTDPSAFTHVHESDGTSGPPLARFIERLPARLRGAELYAVQAQDHYLRLHTNRGSDLILMRLGDAISELDGIEGARTHRSWWVARAAVLDVKRAKGQSMLSLPNGLDVPVSRNYAQALSAAGWL